MLGLSRTYHSTPENLVTFDLVTPDRGINSLATHTHVLCKNTVQTINVWFNNIKKKVMPTLKRGIKVVLHAIGPNYNNNLLFFS